MRGALPAWRPKHCPTITDPREVGQLLRDIDSHKSDLITRCAMKLTPLLFVRPGELRQAEWAEVNLDASEWRIPAAKMKGRTMHIVRLSRRAHAASQDFTSSL